MSAPAKLKIGILVISETASKDPSTDRCIPALQDVVDQDGGDQWEIVATKTVPDNVSEIQKAVTQWTDTDAPLNLVLTSGGTGFAKKDNTPEVCPVIHWN